MKKIICCGNALTDILLQIPNDEKLSLLNLQKGSMQLVSEQKMEEISRQIELGKGKKITGGSAANTSNSIAKLGGESGFLGKVGKDEVGMFYAEDLTANGVKTYLLQSATPSGRCAVMISPDGERTMCTYLGAAAELAPADAAATIFDNYDILHIEGYLVQNHKLIKKCVAIAKEKGMLVSLDLASFNVVEENLEFLLEIIDKYVDIVFANELEAQALTGKTPEEALEIISQMTDIAIVKLGFDGSLIKSDGKVYNIPTSGTQAVDTTGAGDSYAAGFLYGLSKHYELDICGKIGAMIADKVVEVIGAKLDDATWRGINAAVIDLTH